MSILGRKPKNYGDMIADPAFVYQIGRLIGATEMASQLLTTTDPPPDYAGIGENLAQVVDWFFVPEGHKPPRRALGASQTRGEVSP